MRADAIRNRARILEIAEALFAEIGAAVDIALVARRAGVGVGTVYRHFATKEALFQALVAQRIDAFTAEALAIAPEGEAGPAFFAMLDRFVEMYVGNKHVCDAVALDGSGFEAVREPFRAALREGLRRAQRTGAVRDDIDAEDVMTLVCGAFALPVARQPAKRARLVAVLRDGLRAPGTGRDKPEAAVRAKAGAPGRAKARAPGRDKAGAVRAKAGARARARPR